MEPRPKARINNQKKLANSNIASTCSHNMVNLSPLARLRSVYQFGAPQQISTCFACWLRFCTNVAQRISIKLCTMFSYLLGWYTIIYIFGGSYP